MNRSPGALTMICPKCNFAELTLFRTDYGKNLVCLGCAGQMGSISYLLQKKEAARFRFDKDFVSKEKKLHCPKCEGTFQKERIVGKSVACTVDLCYKCGFVWYDKAELETLFPQSGPAETMGAVENNHKGWPSPENLENFKKKEMIRAVHYTSDLDPKDRALIYDFIENGPKVPKEKRSDRKEFSWWDLLDTDSWGDSSDGGSDGGDGD